MAPIERYPTIADVDRIAAVSDPVIRNLQITQAYHELAAGVAARVGGANWCTFATWASKQAGQTIRKEDLAHLLEGAGRPDPAGAPASLDGAGRPDLVGAAHLDPAGAGRPDAVVAPASQELVASARALGSRRSAAEVRETVWDVINPLGAVDRASDAVGRGNLKVFAEIGREFARFLAVCLDDPDCDAATVAQFCAGLHPGDPPEGQQYLRQAFGHYHGAILEADAALRAQRLLLANLEIGYHEQTRLQPEIAEAMNAALIDREEFRRRLIKALFPRNTWLTRLRLFLPRLFGRPDPIDAALDDLLAEARRLAHLVVTERMMTLGLPHGVVLRLGDDVPGTFPPSLVQITLTDLQELIARFDPTPDSTRGSGAADWSALSDRLRYIVDLFRCYHEAADLLDPPFMAGQVTALEAGLLPEGRL